MLQLYDKNKNKLKGLTKYKDYCIESVLKTGDKTLSFLYPSKFIDGIVEEGYIRNKTDEFVIKEMVDRGDWTSIKAQMNVEDLEGKALEHFNTTEQTIENCLNLACAGTGWTVQVNNVSKKRTVKKTNCSSWEIIQEAKKIYRVEIEFDTLNKVVKVYEKLGHDKGVYFSDEINLKALDIESNSYDFYTKIIAIGKENIKIEVENFQYSNKVKTLIWKDERYTVLENLREDATAKLQELSKPRKSYSADVIDLAKLNSKYKNILDYKLGDTITLISKDKKIREKQRIVKIVEYPDEPERNSCEIANTTLDFIDIQKEFQDTADTVNNITEDNGTISEEAIKVAVKNLTIDKADINSLNAAVARIGTLEATKANITELNAVNAKITNLQVNKANITDLTATNIKFDVASGGTLDLQTLLSKFVTGENGQFLNLTTDNVTISNALIKDVIAKSISVEDLKASTISTNKFKIASDNGGIEIVGATQQFKDKNNKVRIQMGQDTQGNFNFILRGEDGTTTLIDHTGIKEKAIADDLIKEKMIAENAVGEKQINYSSLVTGLNKDANTSLIQASKVAIDLTGQKLDVAFNSLKSNVDGFDDRIVANTTLISAVQGQVSILISDNTINKGDITTLKSNYTSVKATVDGISTTVAKHTTSISDLATDLNGVSGKVATVENKQATLEQSLNGFKTTVSSTYATKTELSTANSSISSLQTRMSSAESKITDSAIVNTVRSSTSYLSDLNSKANTNDVANIYATKSSLAQTSENIIAKFSVSGGANLLINSSFEDGISSWSKYSSKGDFEGTVVDAGGFNKPSLKTLKIEMSNYTGIGGYNQYVNVNPNTTYTLSGYIRVYSLTSLTGRSIGISVSEYNDTEATGNSWLAEFQDTTINTSLWRRVSVTFTTGNTANKVQVFFRITNVSQATVYFDNLKMEKGSVLTDWTASNNELIEGNTKINKDGITIYNGALTIQNKVGKNVLKADNDGNLELGGIFRTYSSSDNKSVEIIRESINLYDWVGSGREEPTGHLYSGRMNNDNLLPTVNVANDYCSALTLASRNINAGTTTYYMVLDKFKIDVSNYNPINFKENADLRGNSLYLNQYAAGRIYGTSANAMMLNIGENSGEGLAIYGKDGGTQFVRIEKTYAYPITMYQHTRFTQNAYVDGNFTVKGTKSCIEETKSYGERLMMAYELPSSYYGDIGSGLTDENGECIIYIDDVVSECINTITEYQVFLQCYGEGNLWIEERKSNYFIVKGTKNLKFGWELKALRKNRELERNLIFNNDYIPDIIEFEFEEDKEPREILENELNFELDDYLLN